MRKLWFGQIANRIPGATMSRVSELDVSKPSVVGCALLFALLVPPDAPHRAFAQAPCPSCANADSLIRRFQLPEALTPIRQSPGWARPTKIVTYGGSEWAAALRALVPGAEVIGVADAAAALSVLKDADVYIGLCNPDIIRVGTRLKWVQLISAGADRCATLPEVAERGITITNAQAIFAPQLADHTMGMLLSLSRRLNTYHDQQRKAAWQHPVASVGVALDSGVWELEGKSMLVLGLGGVGTEIARRAHAFGMRVSATRNSKREGPDFVEYVGLSNEASTLAARADVVVNVVPLTKETRGIYDAAFFRSMKPTAYFINVSRGESVITNDLVEALRNRRIAGAGLDVTDPEPLPPDHPFWQMPNVVLTPHSGGASDQVKRRILVLTVENLRRYVQGDRLLCVVDLQRGY